MAVGKNYKYLAYISNVNMTPTDFESKYYTTSEQVMWIHIGQREHDGTVTSNFSFYENEAYLPTTLYDVLHKAYPYMETYAEGGGSDVYNYFYIYPLTPFYDDKGTIQYYYYNTNVNVRMCYCFSAWQDIYDSHTGTYLNNLYWRYYRCELWRTDTSEWVIAEDDFNTGLGNISGVSLEDVRTIGLSSSSIGVPLISDNIKTFFAYPDTSVLNSPPYEYKNMAKKWKWRDRTVLDFVNSTTQTPNGLMFTPWYNSRQATLDEIFNTSSPSALHRGTCLETAVFGDISGSVWGRWYYNPTYNTYLYYMVKAVGGESGFAIGDELGKYEIDDGEDSTEDYRGGDYDVTSDDIDYPDLPIATLDGGIKLFSMGAEGYRDISNSIYSISFSQWLRDYFTGTNMLDYIVSIKAMPSNIAPITYSTPSAVGFGLTSSNAYNLPISSDLINIVNRYTIFDCGTLDVTEFFGSFLDYAPSTKISLVLPFCSIVSLNTDDVMDSAISLKYYIDLLTGECVAHLKITRTRYKTSLDSVLYTYRGQLGQEYPLNQNAYFSMLAPTLQLTGMALGSLGGVGSVVGGAMSKIGGHLPTKTSIHRSGSIGGNVGLMSPLTPYLIIERPISNIPSDYGHIKGYTLGITMTLSDLDGFSKIDDIVLDDVDGMLDVERTQLKAILKEGIIV